MADSEERSKQMILDEERWPQWPFLPMKQPPKDGQLSKLGCLLGGGPPYYVLHSNFFKIEKDAPRDKYETVDGILQAGWVVD
jgi:hypothetical protein